MNDLVLITFTILLPLTPAYILYKALPAKTKVFGPFKGLNIQLSGAFAGYFLLVLVIMGFVSTRANPPDPTHEVWKVTGKLNLDSSWTDTERDSLQLSVIPGSQHVYPTGDFEMQVVPEVCSGGKLKFPKVFISHDGYQKLTIDLENPQFSQISQSVSVTKDFVTKDLAIQTAIDLPRDPSYEAAQAQIPKPQTGGNQ